MTWMDEVLSIMVLLVDEEITDDDDSSQSDFAANQSLTLFIVFVLQYVIANICLMQFLTVISFFVLIINFSYNNAKSSVENYIGNLFGLNKGNGWHSPV